MDFLSTRISVFRNAADTQPKEAELRAFLNSTRHAEAIQALRSEPKKEVRNALKKALPAATISGTFSKRAAANIIQYNGLVCLDFDADANPGISADEMKRRLAEYQEVAYAAISVGGAGVFAIIPTDCTDPAQHADLVDFLGNIIASEGLHYDRACKDVSRLRFISYDPQAYVNPNPSLFPSDFLRRAAERRAAEMRPPRPLVVRQRKNNTDDHTRQQVEEYVAALEGSCRDITENYEDWIRLGFALASYFGADGENYFQRISQFHPKYDQAETAKKYANLLAQGRRIRIGTFFKILQNHGIHLS